MVCLRFVTLSVGTLLALLSMINFSAYAQDSEVPVAEESALYGQEEFLAIAIAGLREISLRGRKMGGHEDLWSEINGKEPLKEGPSSLISGANHRCNRRCDNQEKRNFNVTDEVGDENSSARKFYKPKFVLFSADYHGPKQHPRNTTDSEKNEHH